MNILHHFYFMYKTLYN